MRKGLLLVIIISLSSVFSAHAQSPTITNGFSWLMTNQNPDGSWGLQSNLTLINTTEVMDTLRYLEYTGTSYTEGVNWVSSYTATSTDDIARETISLIDAGISVSVPINTLTAYMNPDNGWGTGESFSSDTLDTALALSALKSVNYSNQTTISNAILYLVTNQNSDGGWGFYAGDDSNVYMTAMVLQTFDMFASTFNIKNSTTNIAAYLLAHQNADGGFGSSPSTVYETSLSFLALMGSNTPLAPLFRGETPLQSAINYIATTQSADGSWNEDAYSTALKTIS